MPRNCLVKTDSFRSLVRIHCQASDWHCITFNWRPRHDKLKPIANLCVNCYFKTCLTLLKNPLKWLAEEMIQLLKAPNLIRHVLLELSTLCRWKETCDIECWGLRQPLSEYSFFLPNEGPRNCLVKTDSFRSLVRIHCQASDWHCITFNWRPQTWQVENLLQICALTVTLRLVWLYWKTLWNG